MSYDSWKTTEPDPGQFEEPPVDDEEFEDEDDDLSDVGDDEEDTEETEID